MLEIIAISPNDAKTIEQCGADRIELISAFHEGGLTPSYGLIEHVVQSVKIPVNVMIRPHSHSFVYTASEIQIMKKDIAICRSLGANGVVLGILDDNSRIHENHLQELIAQCAGMDITFHKAIDETADVVSSIKILSKYPQIKTVLTAGGKGNVRNNTKILYEMKQHAKHLDILVGGGLHLNNVIPVMKEAEAMHVHFGSAVRIDQSYLKEIDSDVLKQLVTMVRNTIEE